ncbi:centromere protein H isoform X2 [Cavia porcellus]|uniref:Centromere protein H n=1 Tax=Cavia porcellus TaxID=10141 RepID=A0A286XVV3_CAVPO|nr:centromere protein H [Cavia porcellus]
MLSTALHQFTRGPQSILPEQRKGQKANNSARPAMEPQADDSPDSCSADCGGAGGPPLGAGAGEPRSEGRLALLLRLRAQIKQQLLEYKSMIDANEEQTPDQIIQEKQMEAKVKDLENEIEEVKIAFDMKSLALSRMQLSAALKNDLEKINTESSVLMNTMKEILKLNKSVMKLQQESWELEEKLLDIRKKRLQLKHASENKLLEIQTEKKKRKEELNSMGNSDKIKTMQQILQTEMEIATVIQHVFQNIILGSKVNWAADPALKETVLQLEKDLTTI